MFGISGDQLSNNEVLSPLFPPEILARIFSHSSISNLESASLVCKQWYEVASEHFIWNGSGLKLAAPSMKIVWIKDWERVGLKATWDMRPLNKSSATAELIKGIKVCGIIPQGLTLRKIQEIAAAHSIRLIFFTIPNSPDEFIDFPLSNTCIVGLKGATRFAELPIIPMTALAVLLAIRDKVIFCKTPILCSDKFYGRKLSVGFNEKLEEFQIDNLISNMGFGRLAEQVTLK
jgi:hypothetical protein